MELSDIEKISAIRLRNDRLIGKIYDLYRKEFCLYLRKKLWRNQDVILDIYQDAFMVLCNKIYEDKLNADLLQSSLKTYLFGVGDKLTFNINRKKSNLHNDDSIGIPDIPDDEPGLGEENEKMIQTAVKEMGEPCHTILVKQYWENKGVEEIAAEMKYKNKDAAKTQKYKCIQKLKNEIKGKIVYQC